MIWNLHRQSIFNHETNERRRLIIDLAKISDEALYAYNVYQIEGEGRSLFSQDRWR